MRGVSTTHYIPILLYVAVSGILATMLAGQIGAFISNPALFLDPAIEAASRDIALVCDGKLSQKTMSPPPPGAHYLIMNCQDRINAKLTSDLVLAYNLVQAGRAVKGVYKSLKKNGDELIKTGSRIAEIKKGVKPNKAGTGIILKTSDADDLVKLGKRGDELVDATTAARRNADDVASTADTASSTKTLERQEKQAKEGAQELQKLEDTKAFPRRGGEIEIDCTKNKAMCDAIQYGGARFNQLGTSAKNAGKTLSKLTGLGDDVADTKISAKISVKTKKIVSRRGKVLGVVSDVKNNVLKRLTGKNLWKTGRYTLIWSALKKSRRVGIKQIRNYVSHPAFADINIEFLDEHGEFYDILEGSFYGVKYTSTMINLMNFTNEEDQAELRVIYEKSKNSTGAALQVGFAIADTIRSDITPQGYYETITYVEDMGADVIIAANKETNIDPSIYSAAATEFAVDAGLRCPDDACSEYLVKVLDHSLEFAYNNRTLDEFESFIFSYSGSGLEEELVDLTAVWNYLNHLNDYVQPLSENLTVIQKEAAQWMSENCETYTLTYGDRSVEVSTCGMVIDCSPEDFCYFGLPVVKAEPWIPYIPVGILEGSDLDTISKLAGLNYDSSERVVTPGAFNGCGGQFILSALPTIVGDWATGLQAHKFNVPDENKAYICAIVPNAQRCRVVSCDKRVVTEPNNFVPSPIVEDRENEIHIGGNFVVW